MTFNLKSTEIYLATLKSISSNLFLVAESKLFETRVTQQIMWISLEASIFVFISFITRSYANSIAHPMSQNCSSWRHLEIIVILFVPVATLLTHTALFDIEIMISGHRLSNRECRLDSTLQARNKTEQLFKSVR